MFFASKNIVITGGSSGLGLALAQRMAQQGAHIGLIARNADKLQQAAAAVSQQAAAAPVYYQAVDVVDATATTAAIERLTQQLGGIDILINSAGILREGYFENLSIDTFKEVLDINLCGVINATQAALPQLKASRGQLVNIASVAGLTGVFGYTAYCASKHALVGLTESLRYELRPRGISVQLVCPPEFDSPMVDALELQRTAENKAQCSMLPKVAIEPIVDSTLAAIRAGRYMTVTGRKAAMVASLLRYLPGLFRAVTDRTIARVYQGPDSAK
jgi:3-dehydrosphinganine reductase